MTNKNEHELILNDGIVEGEGLVSWDNEHFKVDRFLENVHYSNENPGFRLRSLDHRGKEIVVTGRINSQDQLVLKGFIKHIYRKDR
jgi:hypothetical protein